jgi:predicted outer membrane lipoprotein
LLYFSWIFLLLVQLCAFGVVYDVTEDAPNSSKEEEKLQGSNQRPAEWRLERCELTTKKEIYSILSRLI